MVFMTDVHAKNASLPIGQPPIPLNKTLKDLEDILAKGIKLTPMMAQYYEQKKLVPDSLLFFRLGDFYELFFYDAIEASRILNITLTHRGKMGEQPIPMAGIPHHSAGSYVDKLTELGIKVAICEQTLTSATTTNSDGPTLIERKITQIATPGLPFDLDQSKQTESYYLCAFFKSPQNS